VCNRLFAAILTIISILLFIQAQSSLVLISFTFVPDVFGFVSTCTRDNPYFPNSGCSNLDGLEKARLLDGVRVRLGDVQRKADMGHIAFSPAEKSQPVVPGRQYR
jgi:hypothetical protein